MKLSYRGVQYQAKPSTIATVPGTVIEKYRGVALRNRVIAA